SGDRPPRRRQLPHRCRATRPARQLAADGRYRTLCHGAALLRHAGWRLHQGWARSPDAQHQHGELPMIRWLLLLIGGALLGGIVPLATIIVLPQTATQDAYARLQEIAPVNATVALPSPTPERAVMPFMDPAFASAVCRYDLSQGPIKLVVPVSPAYTSVSFYTRNNIAYY